MLPLIILFCAIKEEISLWYILACFYFLVFLNGSIALQHANSSEREVEVHENILKEN